MWIFAICLLCFTTVSIAQLDSTLRNNSFKVGVYYFPGWISGDSAWEGFPGYVPTVVPWSNIKPFPDRESLLGYYAEGEDSVTRIQIKWMNEFGINYIVYDWYWKENNETSLEHALRSFLRVSNKDKLKFSILWANHSHNVPKNLRDFDLMVKYWIDNYFSRPDFLTYDNKPVVFIFSLDYLRDNSMKFSYSVQDLLERARAIARTNGLHGIYFVGCVQSIGYWVKDFAPKNGLDALSAYNYHRAILGKDSRADSVPLSNNYQELTSIYEQNWNWMATNSSLPFITPVTAGWDSRPLGSNTPHDNCLSTPESFKLQLLAAKKFIESHPRSSLRNVVICAWNEYSEGAFIEPTKKWGFEYLTIIKKVFVTSN